MVQVESGGYKWSMDGYLISNLDEAKRAVKKDWDMMFVIDGVEGGGKSVLGIQCCKYFDPEFGLDNIAFHPEDFVNKIINAKPYTAVLYDEAFAGLSARATLSQTNKAIVQVLAEIRQKNLFVIIIQPCFFELDKYVSLWRSRALLHVYTGDNMSRGQFSFFNYNKKKCLWQAGKKFFSYKYPKADFVASFSNYYPIDEKGYRALKLEALKARQIEKKNRKDPKKQKQALINTIIYLREENNLTDKQIGEIAGYEGQTIGRLRAEMNEGRIL